MKYYFILLSLFVVSNANAQIGIKTDTPTADLDVNGNARIRVVPDKTTFAEGDRVLIVDAEGNVRKANLNDVYRQVYINNTVYSGKKTSSTLLDLNIGNNYNPLILETTELGSTHYTQSTGAYTVPEDGIYNIVFYYKYGTGLNAGLSLFSNAAGIAIVKQAVGTTTYTTVDNINFGGVSIGLTGLLSVEISLSEAMLNRTVKLTKGDKIYLGASKSLISASLLSSTKATGHIYKISN